MTAALLLTVGLGAILIYFVFTHEFGSDREEQETQTLPALTQLWPGEQRAKGPTIDIIAIHGLDTQSPGTWQTYGHGKDSNDGRVHWLKDAHMLHETFPHAAIYTYDWLSATYKMAVEDGIRGHAAAFLQMVENRPSSGRHLIFIASCFGGLVLAKAIILASKEDRSPTSLIESVRGIVFLGTPFKRSKAATAAQVRVQVARAMGGRSSSQLVNLLHESNTDLDEIVADFEKVIRQNHYRLDVSCFYETKPTQIYNAILPRWITRYMWWQNFVLVPQDSASIAVAGLLPMNVRHGLLNKFSDPNDTNFMRLCNVLKTITRKAEQFDIRHILEQYYKHTNGERLNIERLDGEILPMKDCYINLCIIKHRNDRDMRASRVLANDDARLSMDSRLQVEKPPEEQQVTLATLFRSRQLSDGRLARPRRILIWGQAGVGKSTLCKKIVHDFVYQSLWADLFDYIFWIPLRVLTYSDTNSRTVADLIMTKFFPSADVNVIQRQLQQLPRSRMLFLLDGLDEVSHALDRNTPTGELLHDLLKCENVVVTSRQHSSQYFRDLSPDLELETIGFFPKQMDDYIDARSDFTNEARSALKSFIDQHPVVASLARIPIQLDAMCCCWQGSQSFTSKPTMTLLYQDIECKLWEKFVVLRDKLVPSQVLGIDTRPGVSLEIEFLSRLAFYGLRDGVAEFDMRRIGETSKGAHRMLNNDLISMPFLRSSDDSCKNNEKTFHFIHLTFQEYFAARYFVRHWKYQDEARFTMEVVDAMPARDGYTTLMQDFLYQQKYNVRYNIFWRFVAGLLSSQSAIAITTFIDAVGRKPRDLLGPHHQRLVMNCLNEVPHTDDVDHLMFGLIESYRTWSSFQASFVARHVQYRPQSLWSNECPEVIIVAMLRGTTAEKERATRSLLKMSSKWSTTVLDLIVNLVEDDDSPKLERDAYEILSLSFERTSGGHFLRVLPKLLNKPAEERRSFLFRTLPESSSQFLMEILLGDESPAKTSLLSLLLEPLPLSRWPSFDDLVQLLCHERCEIKNLAATILVRNRQLPTTILESLARLSRNENHTIRNLATEILAKQRVPLGASLEGLVQLLREDDDVTRTLAIEALGDHDELSLEVLHSLIDLLQSKDSTVRYRAAASLKRQSLPVMVLETLVNLLQGGNLIYPSTVGEVLSHQQGMPKEMIETLEELIHDVNPDVQCQSIKILSNQPIFSEQFVIALIQLIGNGLWHVQMMAARTLTRHEKLPQTYTDIVPRLLGSDDTEISEQMARLLLNSFVPNGGSMSALTANGLLSLLTNRQQNKDIRRAAAAYLFSSNRLSVESVDAVTEFVLNPDGDSDGLKDRCIDRIEFPDPGNLPFTLLMAYPGFEQGVRLPIYWHYRPDFITILLSLSSNHMKGLLERWLRSSLFDDLVCYLEGRTLCFRFAEHPVVKVTLKEDQLARFLRARRELWTEYRVPDVNIETDI